MNQSNLELPHSKTSPPTINKINIKNLYVINKENFSILRSKRGYKITNSTSKIKKIKEIMKNCNEKVCRLFSHGEKPHSKGLSLFESTALFVIKDNMRIIMIKERVKEKKKIILKILI